MEVLEEKGKPVRLAWGREHARRIAEDTSEGSARIDGELGA
jgi:hypothetical protein